MSEATLRHIMQRIEGATRHSQIAVFRSEYRGKLNAVFHNTVHTHRQIKAGDKTYIGSFYKNGDLDEVKVYLDGFINK